MKINATCWTSKWNTWSWWKNRVPNSAISGTPLHHNTGLSLATHLPQNIFHSMSSASKRSNKEHIGVFWQQQSATGSTSLSFSHLRTCSGPGFGDFHHNIFLFEPPDCLLPISYSKPPFHGAIGVCAGLLLVSQAGKQIYEGMGLHVEQKILSSQVGILQVVPTCFWRSSLKQHSAFQSKAEFRSYCLELLYTLTKRNHLPF